MRPVQATRRSSRRVVYFFQSKRDNEIFGFTLQEDGKNLPDHFAPYEAVGSADGVVTSVVEAINRDGFYLERVVLTDPSRTKRPYGA
jgi:hypothetical protein